MIQIKDGIVVNTGSKNGVIRQIELPLGRPLQKFISLLYKNWTTITLSTATFGRKKLLVQKDTVKKLKKKKKEKTRIPWKDTSNKLWKNRSNFSLYEFSTRQHYLYEMWAGFRTEVFHSDCLEAIHKKWVIPNG